MNVALVCFTVLTVLVAYSSAADLASTGYFLSNPRIRNFLIRSGLANVIGRKASALYEVSNFRYASDQGTDIRKAKSGHFEILEVDPSKRLEKRISPIMDVQNRTVATEEDRKYSERLFTVLNEMDRNGCVSRLLCEIGAGPKFYGVMGSKIHHYLKSVPPVTWNSATYPYLEAFQGGLTSSRSECKANYSTCSYDLRRMMKFLWVFFKPMDLKLSSGL